MPLLSRTFFRLRIASPSLSGGCSRFCSLFSPADCSYETICGEAVLSAPPKDTKDRYKEMMSMEDTIDTLLILEIESQSVNVVKECMLPIFRSGFTPARCCTKVKVFGLFMKRAVVMVLRFVLAIIPFVSQIIE